MFNISLNEDELKTIYLEEVQKRLEDWEQQTLLMDMKELCKMLSLSRPTVEKFMYFFGFMERCKEIKRNLPPII